ncbi:MAG: hypothetical protein WD231_00670 [Candidatus Woykebacteria bacterium]
MSLGEGDILARLWNMSGWQVGLIWSGGFGLLLVTNEIDRQLHRFRGVPRLIGIYRFRTVMIGDLFIFPTIAALADSVMGERAPSFIGSGWSNWATWTALGLAILATIGFAANNLLGSRRDWTTTRRGRTNLWGIIHYGYFFATAYLLADFGVRGTTIIRPGVEFKVAVVYGASWALFTAYVALFIRDGTSKPPWWYKPRGGQLSLNSSIISTTRVDQPKLWAP